MRRIWFGGSFDPIHHGHLITARAVAESAGYDQVVLVPNNRSPLKLLEAGRATGLDRLAMCRLAVAGDSLFEVDDIEIRRDPPSFTIETVLELAAKNIENANWLIGLDTIANLPRWHRWQELLSVARFVVMGRPGAELDWAALPAEVGKLRATVVQTPLIDISSSDIRGRIAAGRSIRNLVPVGVERFVQDSGLYRGLADRREDVRREDAKRAKEDAKNSGAGF